MRSKFKKELTETQRAQNIQYYACNFTVGACLFLWSYPEQSIYSLTEYVKGNRETNSKSSAFKNPVLSDIELFEFNQTKAFRYTLDALIQNKYKITYQNTFLKYKDKYIHINIWIETSRYPDVKMKYENIMNIFSTDLPKANSEKNNTDSEDLTNFAPPAN